MRLTPYGLTVRFLRKRRNRTIADLASRAGISPSHLSRLEHGQRRLNTDLMGRIAKGLRVPDYFLLFTINQAKVAFLGL